MSLHFQIPSDIDDIGGVPTLATCPVHPLLLNHNIGAKCHLWREIKLGNLKASKKVITTTYFGCGVLCHTLPFKAALNNIESKIFKISLLALCQFLFLHLFLTDVSTLVLKPFLSGWVHPGFGTFPYYIYYIFILFDRGA